MNRSLTLVSIIALIVAILAWGGVWFLMSDISARVTDRAQSLSMSAVQDSKQSNATEVHALVADTATERAQLNTDVSTDIVGIASQINAAGSASGAQTTIGSASVVGTSTTAGLSELEFVVQSTGSFAQVWRAAQLFETLPLPSQVTEIDFEASPDAAPTAQWQLTTHLNVLTSAQVSS